MAHLDRKTGFLRGRHQVGWRSVLFGKKSRKLKAWYVRGIGENQDILLHGCSGNRTFQQRGQGRGKGERHLDKRWTGAPGRVGLWEGV